MKTFTKTQKTTYQNFLKTQNIILEELKELKTKIKILGSLRRFEELAKKGRDFAENLPMY
jgi:hypothetical protein